MCLKMCPFLEEECVEEERGLEIRFFILGILRFLELVHHVVGLIQSFFILSLAVLSEDLVLHLFGVYAPMFVTMWNFSFQTLFLSLAFTHDILEWGNKHETSIGSKIRYWRDIVFSSLVVPFTCFVTGMFWSVYSIDRELVFPKVYDAIVPWWFNHCVHTNIAVVVIAETLLQPRRQPVNRKLEISINTFVSVLYAVVYYSIYFFANRWLYAVFGIMTWWQVCLFQCFIWASVFFFYWIQYPINRMIHGSEPEKEETKDTVKEQVENEIEDKEVEKNNSLVQTESYEERNGLKNPDMLSAPFATKSWSLKYRLIRDQFENSRL